MPDINELREQRTSEIAEIRAAASVLIERIQWMRQAGITFEGLRDLYEVLGYARLLTNRNYRDRYYRGGIAKRIVDAFPDATWRGGVTLIEDEDPKVTTPFEQAWEDEDKRLKIISTLLRADKLAGLSAYAVILIGAPGMLQDELPKGSVGKLLFLSPFSGGGGPNFTGNNQQTMIVDADAMIKEYELDSSNPRYGLPKYYQLRRVNLLTSESWGPSVHWSRIIHIAEGCLDDEVFGIPTLECVWNLLDDLDKVTGGGAEAFWLRANQGFHINFDKDMKDIKPEQKTQLNESLERFKHGIDRFIRTRGVDMTPLGSDVANFLNPADAILTQIAGAKKIPKRILTGSEMGELASSQDRDNWKDQINGRQTGYAEPFILRRLVDRLIDYGYLPTPSKGVDAYDVKWAHMQVMTEDEKASGAQKWAEVNAAAGVTVFSAADIREHWYEMDEGDAAESEHEMWRANGAEKWATINKAQGVTVFTDDEIRDKWYGYSPLTPEQKQPIQAPERISGKVGPGGEPTVDSQGNPLPTKLDANGQPIPQVPATIATDPLTKLPVEVDTRVGLPAHQTHGLSDEQKRTLITKVKADAEAKQQEAQAAKLDAIKKAPGATDKAPLTPEEKKAKAQARAAQHAFASTQVNLPPRIANQLLAFGQSIPDEDLAMPDGREDQPHVTVKYGLHTDSPDTARLLLRPAAPVDLTFGQSQYFEGDEHDVVYIAVQSPDLEDLNDLISRELATTSTFAQYQPHATVAYVKLGLGAKYAGRTALDGQTVTINAVDFINSEDEVTTIPLTGTAVKAAERELVSVLEAAIRADQQDVIQRILGMAHARKPTTKGWTDTTGDTVTDTDTDTDTCGLVKTFTFPDRRICASFITAVMEYANTINHHPDIQTVPNGCTVTWVTHSADDTVTELDHMAATATDAIAQEQTPKVLGGSGSGNFGHTGRPGEIGGSGDGTLSAIDMQKEINRHGLPPTLQDAENLIRNEAVEHGFTVKNGHVTDYRGDTSADGIHLRDGDWETGGGLDPYHGAVFTHNHPSGNAFSPDDGFVAASHKMAEIRAATHDGAFSLKPRGEWPNPQELLDAASTYHTQVFQEFTKQIVAHKMSTTEASEQHWKTVWTRVAQHHFASGGVDFSFEPKS